MNDNTVRVDKYLSSMGICARRNVDYFLKKKIVTLNGERIKEGGVRFDPTQDELLMNGQRLKQPQLVYFLLNKPKGIISTVSDELGRRNVVKLIKTPERIFPVGRLDKDTSGLLILTNDGELTNLLIHPRYHIPKIYELTVDGKVTEEQLKRFRIGVMLEDGLTSPSEIRTVAVNNGKTILHAILHEGKKRQIRRMCEQLKIPLIELKRIQFGPLKLGNLKEGQYRELTKEEVKMLKSKPRFNHSDQ
jgi:23S rRNA pseudouridine2605 synthase